jgi:hypothetical protein
MPRAPRISSSAGLLESLFRKMTLLSERASLRLNTSRLVGCASPSELCVQYVLNFVEARTQRFEHWNIETIGDWNIATKCRTLFD